MKLALGLPPRSESNAIKRTTDHERRAANMFCSLHYDRHSRFRIAVLRNRLLAVKVDAENLLFSRMPENQLEPGFDMWSFTERLTTANTDDKPTAVPHPGENILEI